VAKIPRPPAFETAATNCGVEIQLIPGKIIGYLIPSKRVIRVCIFKDPKATIRLEIKDL
jgi:hypothetical protein